MTRLSVRLSDRDFLPPTHHLAVCLLQDGRGSRVMWLFCFLAPRLPRWPCDLREELRPSPGWGAGGGSLPCSISPSRLHAGGKAALDSCSLTPPGRQTGNFEMHRLTETLCTPTVWCTAEKEFRIKWLKWYLLLTVQWIIICNKPVWHRIVNIYMGTLCGNIPSC